MQSEADRGRCEVLGMPLMNQHTDIVGMEIDGLLASIQSSHAQQQGPQTVSLRSMRPFRVTAANPSDIVCQLISPWPQGARAANRQSHARRGLGRKRHTI